MRVAVGMAVLVLLLATGCAPEAPPDPFPPRPFAIDVAGLDPCRALTRAQIDALGPAPAQRSGQPIVNGRPSRACGWTPALSGAGYSVQTIGVDAGDAVGAPNNSVETVLGFGVVRAPDLERSIPTCDYLIDAADGALIRITARSMDLAPDGSKAPVPLLCEQAKALAVDVLTNLRAAAVPN